MVWLLPPDRHRDVIIQNLPVETRHAGQGRRGTITDKDGAARMADEGVVRYFARHVSIVLVGAQDPFDVVLKHVAGYVEGEIGLGERRALQARRELF